MLRNLSPSKIDSQNKTKYKAENEEGTESFFFSRIKLSKGMP